MGDCNKTYCIESWCLALFPRLYKVPAAAAPANSARAAAAQPPAANRTPPAPREASPASRAVSLRVTTVDSPVVYDDNFIELVLAVNVSSLVMI